MLLVQGERLVHQSLRVDPAQGVLQNVELSGIIAHDHQIVAEAMAQHAAQRGPFDGDLDVALGADIGWCWTMCRR